MNKSGQMGKTMTFFIVLIPVLILSALFLSGAYYLKKNQPLSPSETISMPNFVNEIVTIEDKPYTILDAFILYKQEVVKKEDFSKLFLDKIKDSKANCVFLVGRNSNYNPGRNEDFFAIRNKEGNFEFIGNAGSVANRIKPYIADSIATYNFSANKIDLQIYAYEGECLHE